MRLQMPQKDPSSTFEARAIECLREAGLRITNPRIAVIRALAQSKKALSANEIYELVKRSGGSVDVVSVYRTLAMLLENHLVHHLGVVDGYLACGMEEPHGPLTEHLVCQECGTVTELEPEGAMAALNSEKFNRAGFVPSEVKIEVLGRCAKCK